MIWQKRRRKRLQRWPIVSLKRNRTKAHLIKGMSRRLPIELLDEPSFKDGLQQIMRNYGVYALYRKNTLYYVGLATNLYWRLLAHTKNRNKGKWDRFAIFRVGRVRYLKDMETLLLRVAAPPGNKVSGHLLHRDADLTRVLRRIQREQLQRLKRIKIVMR